jgi:hypothetical protein
MEKIPAGEAVAKMDRPLGVDSDHRATSHQGGTVGQGGYSPIRLILTAASKWVKPLLNACGTTGATGKYEQNVLLSIS